MPTSNYPGGFASGVSILGMPLLNSYGNKVFWVHSGTGGNGNKGTFSAPLATIDYAIGLCTASRGDIIMVKPGHAETITAAAGIACDVAGINIVGLGTGSLRPTITFSTATTATMTVSAANVTLSNLLFVNGIDALVSAIVVSAAGCKMFNCETRDNNSSFAAVDFITTTAAANFLHIYDWVHDASGGKTGADTAISIVGGANGIIQPRSIIGNFAVACIENVTTAATDLQVFGSANFPAYLKTTNSADVIFTAVATTTGRVGPFINARLKDNAANITEAFVGVAMEFFQPINIVNADGESSMQTNITASTDT